MPSSSLLPSGWNPKAAADRVLTGLVNINEPRVKGAHDSDFVLIEGKAYIVSMSNDVQPSENPFWPFVYGTFTTVDLATLRVEQSVTFASSEMAYDNAALPVGAIFVPRIIRKDARTLRVFFASEDPANRQSLTWRIDYDLASRTFCPNIYPMELETDAGVFPMEPRHFYEQAKRQGFSHPPVTYGMYLFDGIKTFDGTMYVHLNVFPGAQLGMATLNPAMDRLTVIGNFFSPPDARLTESAFNRLPDGTWLAISRRDDGDNRYLFTESRDGRTWSAHTPRDFVPCGNGSKPAFEKFGDVYYLGWQDAASCNGVFRSVFNVDVSRDGKTWERKYRFETEKAFQYPTMRATGDAVWLAVTQGDSAPDRKERIMFGKLEDLA